MSENQIQPEEQAIVAQGTEVANAAQESPANDMFADLFNNGPRKASASNSNDVLRECLTKPNFKLFKGLDITNINTREFDNVTRVYITLAQDIIGDVAAGEEDAFGNPIMSLGVTNIASVTTIDFSSVMKRSGRSAIFANDVTVSPDKLNVLFNGGKCDLLIQIVEPNTDYVNPFSRNREPIQFDRRRAIHYLTSITMGDAGNDLYAERIKRAAM